MPLEILHLIASQGFYGAERVTAQLCSSLAERGHGVMLGVLGTGRPELLETFRQACSARVRVTPVECKRRIDPRTLKQIRSLMVSGRIHLLHTHGYKADLYGYVASRLGRKPVVATCHNWTGRDASLRFYRALDKRVLRRFDGRAAVSESVAEQLEQAGIARDRIEVIPNGIDTKSFVYAAATTGEPVLGVLSRLSWEKGIDVLVRALPLVQREVPEMTCTVAGEGPERDPLRKLAIELGVSSALRMPGFVSADALLAQSSVFVLPSRTEGTPMSLLEAMAAAKPIVAAAVGGVPDIVEHNRTGLLVRAADPVALAQAIVSMLRDPDAAKEMGARARSQVCKRFSIGSMTNHYLRLYSVAVEHGRGVTEAGERELEKAEG